MSEKNRPVVPGDICVEDLSKIKEAVCLQVEKVYDSCKEKDCIEDLEVFGLPKGLVRRAIDVSCQEVEVEDVIIDIEPLKFKRGFFTVTVSFVFRVCVELFFRNQAPQRRCGVAMFTKKVVLFGSQGRVKIFKAKFRRNKPDIQHTPFLEQDNRPIGKVEVAEPVCLAARIEEEENETSLTVQEAEILNSILASITQVIAQTNAAAVTINAREQGPGDQNIDVDIDQTNIITAGRGNKPERKVLVTIGLFSIIKLVRFVQILVPAFGFCNPPTCVEAVAEEACELFDTIEFPKEAFFPPQKQDFPVAGEEEHDDDDCGCHK